MSKIKQGKFKANVKSIKLIERLNTIVEFFKDDMQYREINFEMNIQPELKKHHVVVDEARLSIVLYNLLSNSVKHTTGDSITLTVNILSRQEMVILQYNNKISEKEESCMNDGSQKSNEDSDEGSWSNDSKDNISEKIGESESENTLEKDKDNLQYLQIIVSDKGCGMNDESSKKCFTLFGNLKFKKDINQGGIGLGLASASLICKALGGFISLVKTKEEEGSVF